MVTWSRPLEKWFRGSEWGVKPLDETIAEYDAVRLERWGVSLKYQLVDLEPTAPSKWYDPFTETPDAYLRFARLGEYDRFRWDANQLIREVLRFFKEFGPPWWPGGTLDLDLEDRLPGEPPPLTVERVIYEALNMVSVIRPYQLLCKIESGDKTVSELKEYMTRIQSHKRRLLDFSYLATNSEGLRMPAFLYDRQKRVFRPPPLRNDNEVISAAIAYLEAGVGEGLAEHRVYPKIVNREWRSDGGWVIGVWVPAFSFYSLLAALWWQVYSAILKHTQFKECANERCLILFDPVRSDQEYCNRWCRDATRKRKKYQIQKLKGNNQAKEANHERSHSKKGKE